MNKTIIWLVLLITVFFLALPPYRASYSAPPEPVKPPIREYAEQMVNETFGGGWAEFDAIVKKESGWKSTAQNPHSSAHGLCQLLKGTYKWLGSEKTLDPYKQVDLCIKYIKIRYKTPEKALIFWNNHKWF